MNKKSRRNTGTLLPFSARTFLQHSVLLLAITLSWPRYSHLRADGFASQAVARPHFSSIATTPKTPVSSGSVLFNYNNDDNGDNNKNDKSLVDFELLSRRFERADKTLIRDEATLVACYVLCRFLVYDISSGAKIEPGWEIQDFIWLTGTFSSATVLVIYYTVAGLLSRSFEEQPDYRSWTSIDDGSDSKDPSSSVVKAVVNVVLCCPIWLATEHLFGFGPADIGGNTLSVAVATGFLGFGSFMALAKILTAGMR